MNNPINDDLEQGDHTFDLPEALNAAIQRAQSRVASPAQIAKLTNRLLLGQQSIRHEKQIARPRSTLSVLTAVSALVLLMICFQLLAPISLRPTVNPPREANSDLPIESPITRIPLISVVFAQIRDDLDRAEVRLEEVSESLKLAAIRREIQEILDQSQEWSK